MTDDHDQPAGFIANTRGHVWRLGDEGKPDMWAFDQYDSPHCHGPFCTVCLEPFCVICDAKDMTPCKGKP